MSMIARIVTFQSRSYKQKLLGERTQNEKNPKYDHSYAMFARFSCGLFACSFLLQISKKNLDSMHVLGLEHIRLLQDKDLLRCFSQLESDELSKWHTRTCTLMPTKCSVTLRSYASEHGADKGMTQHLRDHVKALILESESKCRFATCCTTYYIYTNRSLSLLW